MASRSDRGRSRSGGCAGARSSRRSPDRNARIGVFVLLARVSVAPLVLGYAVRARLFGRYAAWVWVSERAASWRGPSGNYRRAALFQRLLPRAGRNLQIRTGTMVTKWWCELGNDVYVGQYCVLGDVEIGDDVMIGSNVSIPSGARGHAIDRLDVPFRMQEGTPVRIHIGEDTWIGSGAVVLADVGAHCVVGGGAVVTRPVPDHAIVAGNPARQIGDRRSLQPEGARTMPP